jgi:16S rRNA A1518/A1519 N6-dimethyltransferase RsmA/KsgA/DIM1 with predicted DNA glycosylase/AP lyase activity
MLRASLKGYAKQQGINPVEWLEKADIDPQLRPETLAVEAFHRLTDVLKLSA